MDLVRASTPDRETAAAILDDEHRGCFRLSELEGILFLNRESIREMAIKRNVGHRAPRHTGRTGTIHLNINDIATIYPRLVSHHRKRRRAALQPLTASEHAQQYPETIQPGNRGSDPV